MGSLHDVEGAWNVTIATPVGKQKATLEFTSKHGRLLGVAVSQDESVRFEPMIEGNRLRWSMRMTKPIQLKLTFDVTIDSDEMSGMAKAGFLPASKVRGTRMR